MKKGQVWIETVLYTLIGLALIGLVLAIAMPKINAAKDKIVVEQTIESLSSWDGKINELLSSAPGNVRTIPSFQMRRGELYINSSADTILFILNDLSTLYSEPGVPIEVGEVTLVSSKGQRSNSVLLTLDYKGIANLTYDGGEEVTKFVATPTPYSFSLENKGGTETININIKELSRGV